MVSVRTANLDHVDTHSLAARDCPARLSLKPSSSTRSALDGVWWPRSRAPAIKLSTLVEAVDAVSFLPLPGPARLSELTTQRHPHLVKETHYE